MPLRNLFQKAGNFVDVVGTKVGLPEFGISEALSPGGTSTFSGLTPQSQSVGVRPQNYLTNQANVSAAKWQPTQYGPPAPTTLNDGGSTLGVQSYNQQPQQTTQSALQNLVQNQSQGVEDTKAQEEARRQEFIQQQTQQINSSFAPIFSELDRRIGILPQVKGEQEAAVQNIAQAELGGIDQTAQLGLGGLNQTLQTAEQRAGLMRGQVENQSLQNIRELESDLNRASASGLRRLGAAGDSSAAQQVSESVYRTGLREKGRQLGLRDELFTNIDLNLNNIVSEIGQKAVQVQQLAAQQKAGVESWKQRQLADIANAIRSSEDQLRGMMANTSREQQQMIANLQQQVYSDAETRLRQLDDEVRNFKTSIDQWQVQRLTDFEDYQRQLVSASSYTPQQTEYKLGTYDNGAVKTPFFYNPYNPQDVQPIDLSGFMTGQEEEEQPGAIRQLLSGNLF